MTYCRSYREIPSVPTCESDHIVDERDERTAGRTPQVSLVHYQHRSLIRFGYDTGDKLRKR